MLSLLTHPVMDQTVVAPPLFSRLECVRDTILVLELVIKSHVEKHHTSQRFRALGKGSQKITFALSRGQSSTVKDTCLFKVCWEKKGKKN